MASDSSAPFAKLAALAGVSFAACQQVATKVISSRTAASVRRKSFEGALPKAPGGVSKTLGAVKAHLRRWRGCSLDKCEAACVQCTLCTLSIRSHKELTEKKLAWRCVDLGGQGILYPEPSTGSQGSALVVCAFLKGESV
eukprot:scaffold160134_cov17-Tisochrysis_lutea.AAC.2